MLVFILGLQCGIEGAYGSGTVGSPSVAGAFTALCDLREVIPYAFGYMMAAKVGTGFVAELGSMRISDEIDALEVMGLDSLALPVRDPAAGHVARAPVRLHRGHRGGFFASYIAVVVQIGKVSAGGYFQIFWQFQSPMDLFYSAVKAMAMATFSCSSAATTATRPAAGRSGWAGRPPSRWW